MKHANIPVFIPHLGCPNGCVFCDQKQVTGHGAPVGVQEVRVQIARAAATLRQDAEAEIAFFGGSFTGIGNDAMTAYLEAASPFVDGKQIGGIRLSTRPDYIDAERLRILSQFPVRHIELGIQSMDDAVLRASARGHTAAQTERACAMIRGAGFSLTGQMMVGLPASSEASEVETARKIVRMGARSARIYPTVVLRGTELQKMAERGEYVPLTEEESVARCASVLEVFERADVTVLRIGLCATDLLCGREAVWGDTYRESVGEMARGELAYRRLCAELDAARERGLVTAGKTLYLRCPKGRISQIIGQNRRNAVRLCARYDIARVRATDGADTHKTEWSVDAPFGKET